MNEETNTLIDFYLKCKIYGEYVIPLALFGLCAIILLINGVCKLIKYLKEKLYGSKE